MRTTIRTALFLASLLSTQVAYTQDQEEGPVELAPSSDSSFRASASASAETPRSASESRAARNPGDAPGPLRVYGGFRLGVGGGFKPTDPSGDFLYTASATPGLQLGVDYVLMEYFALGGETRLGWVRAKADDERVMLWDLVVKPRARTVLSSQPIELYAALPFGLSLSNQPNDARPERTGRVSATLGLSGGAYYFFNQHMGINAELGWLWNWIRSETEVGEAKLRLGQLTLINVNFTYAF